MKEWAVRFSPFNQIPPKFHLYILFVRKDFKVIYKNTKSPTRKRRKQSKKRKEFTGF